MEKNLLFIVNPKAGSGNIRKRIPKITNYFFNQGYSVDIIYTKKNYLPNQIIREYQKKIDLVVCCGGDGTLNEVINAIMKLKNNPPISFIPLGTMNDFARTVHLSKRIFYSVRKKITKPKKLKSDIGEFNNQFFNYVAAFGAFTNVPYITTHKLKKRFGKFAYFWVARKCFNKIKTYNLKIKIQDEIIEDKFIYGSISNSKSIGGFKWFKNKDVGTNDGKFELLLVKSPKNISEWACTIFWMLFKQYDKKYFYFRQINNVKIYTSAKMPWTLDGEYGGRHQEVKIYNIHNAIEYIIP